MINMRAVAASRVFFGHLPVPVLGLCVTDNLVIPCTRMLRFGVNLQRVGCRLGRNSAVCTTGVRSEVQGRRWFTDDSAVLDTEREMFQLKRSINTAYSQGKYNAALSSAQALKSLVERTVGKENVIYASTLNNAALMVRAACIIGNF